LLIGFELLKTSVEKIIDPEKTEFSIVSTLILSIAVIVKLWLYIFNKKIAKKINSGVMKATAADSLSDAGATLAVLVSSLVLRFFDIDIDAYMGIGVSVLILIAGINVLNEAKNVIIGEAPDEALVEELKSIAFSHEEVLGIHDLMIHSYGAGTTIASFHAEVDGKADVFLIHDAIDNIEKELFEKIGVRCTVHMDPIVTDDEEILNMKLKAAAAVKEIDGDFTIHDFRLVTGVTHTNLIFDVVVPFECTTSEDEIIDSIDKKIKENLGESYCTVLTIDKG
jgi:cation diffusion facilitator family transporter